MSKRTRGGIPQIRWARVSFFVRSRGLQLRRAIKNIGAPVRPMPLGDGKEFPFVLAESTSSLWTSDDPKERDLLLGKLQNLRVACRYLDGRVLSPGQIFSFWRQIGRPVAHRGFVVGREVREGCVIPTVGGGLCQLSGALIELASSLGFKLVERHRHTALPPDVPYVQQRDATLFWNYVDLRFSSPFTVMFETQFSENALIVRVRGKTPIGNLHRQTVTETQERPRRLISDTARSRSLVSAYVMGERQVELENYVRAQAKVGDSIYHPFRLPAGELGLESTLSPPLFRLRRSIKLRAAVARGRTVAIAHFALDRELASYVIKHMDYRVEHVCVAQTMLPYLWRSGGLAGRSFDVLMYRAPVAAIQKELETAVALYPHSTTLREFRAPQWFVEAEAEALAAARQIITPHAQIASLFDNSLVIPWEPSKSTVKPSVDTQRDRVVFLGPTLGRKGAFAVREVVRNYGIPITVVGSMPEGTGFWDGLPVTHTDLVNLDWTRIHTIMQPALFEYWPRQLLNAHAAGARLIVSPGCGISENREAGILHVPFGEVTALGDALRQSLDENARGR